MKLYYLLILIIFASCQAAVQPVMIYQQSSSDRLGPCEPSIAISRNNRDIMMVGSILNNYHYSEDGGKNWTTEKLRSPHGVYGDPCVVSDPEGNFYYFHLGDPDHRGWESERLMESIVVQKWIKSSSAWSEGSAIGTNPPKDQDKEWAAVDPISGNIYVTWTEFDEYGSKDPECKTRILFSSSTDGNSWSDPVKINKYDGNCLDGDKTVEGAVPAVAADGTIYVAWSGNGTIFYNYSHDQGKSWGSGNRAVAQQIGGWEQFIPQLYRVNGMPVTLADRSNLAFNGNIYVVWSDSRNGEEDIDVFISRSEDGRRWTLPIRVNTDTTTSHQFFPWAAIDQSTGYIYVIYYDQSQVLPQLTEVTMAVSKDGGETWQSAVVGEKPFKLPDETVFFGDYNNIDATGGVIRPVWTEFDPINGLSIWTSIIKPGRWLNEN